MEGGMPFWQTLILSSILGWVLASSAFDLTRRVRALTQPWVTRRVIVDTPSILRLQVSSSDQSTPFSPILRASLCESWDIYCVLVFFFLIS